MCIPLFTKKNPIFSICWGKLSDLLRISVVIVGVFGGRSILGTYDFTRGYIFAKIFLFNCVKGTARLNTAQILPT